MGSPLGHNINILLGDGKGGFQPGASLPSDKLTNYVALGDFNKDGKPDIVASNYAGGNVTVYLNTTK